MNNCFYNNISYKLYMDEAITCLPLVAFIISAIAISVYLSKRLQGSKFKTQQAEFQWSISGDCMDMKKSLKHGVDLKNLERENLPQIAYLTITQKKYQILRCMSGWNVSQLNRLYLRDNNILSIEPITKINMPNIEVLVLSDNKISSLKSLRKLPTLKLIWLELQNNPLSQELTFLSQMRLANLHYMWVEFFNSDKQFNDDLSWLSKCQSIILTKFYSSSAKRIVVEKFIDVMERKYLNFDIKMH